MELLFCGSRRSSGSDNAGLDGWKPRDTAGIQKRFRYLLVGPPGTLKCTPGNATGLMGLRVLPCRHTSILPLEWS